MEFREIDLSTALLETSQFLTDGAPGAIQVRGNSINISDFSQINSINVSGLESGQSVLIEASDRINLNSNSSVTTSVIDGTETAGNITFRARDLSVVAGIISSSSQGTGKGGNVTFDIDGTFEVGDEGFVATSSFVSGSTGSIFIEAGDLRLFNGGVLQSSNANASAGDGGEITINASNLTMDEGSNILTTSNFGTGGDINIDVRDRVELRNGSSISASVGQESGGGDGGNIDITAQFVTAVPSENSDITANAFDGRGGNIAITANGVFGIAPRSAPTELSDITASSRSNLTGRITIEAPDIDTNRDAIAEPNASSPPEVVRGCQAGRIQTASSFVDVGRGGLPPNPAQARSGSALWEDFRPLPPSVAKTPAVSPQPISTLPSDQPAPIVEAQGWIVNAAGDIELVAAAPNAIATASGFSDRNCDGLAPHS
ncbi:MAG: S-layer family protein [Cyanobacteria bacterium J06639_1]